MAPKRAYTAERLRDVGAKAAKAAKKSSSIASLRASTLATLVLSLADRKYASSGGRGDLTHHSAPADAYMTLLLCENLVARRGS